MNPHPKVLIFCKFSQHTANGITIANLFKHWPTERIAVVEFNDGIEDVYVPNIAKYYLLGHDEIRYVGPFRKLVRAGRSEAREQHTPPTPRQLRGPNRPTGWAARLRQIIRSMRLAFLNRSGLSLVSKQFSISPALDAWIDDFAPDVIYASVGDICKMDFMTMVQKRYGVPLTIHVFDDFVASKHQYTWCPAYWKRRLETSFRRYLDCASVHLAISNKMAEEYATRYECVFHTFHNPIVPSVWLANTAEGEIADEMDYLSRRSRPSDRPFTFVYAGKVNKDTARPIARFIRAVHHLRGKGMAVDIKIYSPYPSRDIQRVLGPSADAHYQGRVAYGELPAAFRGGDAMLLPLDHSDETIRYIRLSMLTKATEYMISGRPIFLFGPPNVAVSEYLNGHGAAFTAEDPLRLETSILEFIDDSERRRCTAARAFRLAVSRHLLGAVCERLRVVLTDATAPPTQEL